MAAKQSFDITTGVDLQEVDNAVNQALKETQTRYDFKGTRCTIELDRKVPEVRLEADDEFRLKALLGVVREKLAKRQVPLKNVRIGDPDVGGLGRARQTLGLTTGIDQDTARRIVKDVKGEGFKKVQVQIQGDELRVTSPSRDELQEVIRFLKARDYGVELKFGNYRSS
ncbi:MAG TPA: YajQ family cyclic di-GMP-binding protein [Longimicrobiales bacterium]|nr:YajQ family cyclic di-GMP-binding protein [Longimicrobiales bacterium]